MGRRTAGSLNPRGIGVINAPHGRERGGLLSGGVRTCTAPQARAPDRRRRGGAPVERGGGRREPDPRGEDRVRAGPGAARAAVAAILGRAGTAGRRGAVRRLARGGGALGGGEARRGRRLRALARGDPPPSARPPAPV